MTKWKEITSLDDWSAILNRSMERPILVLKHSTACPISAGAWMEYRFYLDKNPDENTDYAMVKVIESREVSNQIANELNVIHKSPQLILIRNQKAVWELSHRHITEDRIRESLQ